MIKKLIFGDGKGSAKASDYQRQAHEMCREKLTVYTPVLTTAKEARRNLHPEMRAGLHAIEKQLGTGQWLNSIELYMEDRAFNVWVRYNSSPNAVGLFTYRPDPFIVGDEVEVDVRQWLNQDNKGKPKWRTALITECFSDTQYGTTIGVFPMRAIRRRK